MLDGLIFGIPSEMAVMELLLRHPGAFGLAKDQISALRALATELQSTLIDHSSAIQKAEHRRMTDDNPAAAQDAQAVIGESFAAAAAARARANAELHRLLTAVQYHQAISALPGSIAAATGSTIGHAGPAEHPSKDQKVVEIETAAMIAERVLSWAKLFGWVVALPAALLVAILTVIGVGKYSDFTTLVHQSETRLNSLVGQATVDADRLAKQVADLANKQNESDIRINTLSTELSSVKEQLGFAQDSNIAPNVQKNLQDSFKKFQDYVVHLGYSPGSVEIKIAILKDDQAGSIAYYNNNVIYVAKAVANDPEVIYREYLHHILYSKVGFSNVGPERSALESGIADYLVASYVDSPQIYGQSFGTPVNLDNAAKLIPAARPEDRFPVGGIWAALFWQLRQSIGREITDKAVFGAWFDLSKDLADATVPGEMIAKFLALTGTSADGTVRARAVKILKERGAPLPATP